MHDVAWVQEAVGSRPLQFVVESSEEESGSLEGACGERLAANRLNCAAYLLCAELPLLVRVARGENHKASCIRLHSIPQARTKPSHYPLQEPNTTAIPAQLAGDPITKHARRRAQPRP